MVHLSLLTVVALILILVASRYVWFLSPDQTHVDMLASYMIARRRWSAVHRAIVEVTAHFDPA